MRQRHHHNSSQLSQTDLERRPSNILTQPKYPSKLRQKRTSGKLFWLRRSLRLTYLKLLRLRGKPEVVAKGLALGVFAGSFPFFGVQSLVGICLATIFRGSKVAAMAATWISNPLTYFPIFAFNYKIGKLLLGTPNTDLPTLDINSFTAFKELGATFALTLLTGSFVVGMILAIITYFYSLAILERWQNKRRVRKKR